MDAGVRGVGGWGLFVCDCVWEGHFHARGVNMQA